MFQSGFNIITNIPIVVAFRVTSRTDYCEVPLIIHVAFDMAKTLVLAGNDRGRFLTSPTKLID